MNRFACLRVPFFPATAAERVEPALRERPLAVVTGAPPATRVVDANGAAVERGVRPGMPAAEASARCPALVHRTLSAPAVTSARHALLEAALGVSPRVEDAAPGLVHVDLAGLERLHGGVAAIAGRLLRHARAVGLPARVGVGSTRAAARIASLIPAAGGPCLGRSDITILDPARERQTLAGLPLDVLDLPAALAATLAQWGVSTLGGLAALPREGLAMRVGEAGLRAHDLAGGRDREPFRPWMPPPFWQEVQGLDWEIESLETLAPVVEAGLRRLCRRLEAAHLVAGALEVRLALATGARHERTVRLATPTREPGPILTLVRLALEASPPPAPVVGVAISAEPLPAQAVQGALERPLPPALRDLAAVLARLAALAGPDAVGSPRLDDSYRPDAVRLAPFTPPADAPPDAPVLASGALLAFRRLRPPRPVEVETDAAGRPVHVSFPPPGPDGLGVTARAGPWRSSGEWWDAGIWARDEWDVAMSDRTLRRLAHDRRTGRWHLDGVYD